MKTRIMTLFTFDDNNVPKAYITNKLEKSYVTFHDLKICHNKQNDLAVINLFFFQKLIKI